MLRRSFRHGEPLVCICVRLLAAGSVSEPQLVSSEAGMLRKMLSKPKTHAFSNEAVKCLLPGAGHAADGAPGSLQQGDHSQIHPFFNWVLGRSR